MKEQEEREIKLEDDDMIYTYERDIEKKIWVTEDGQEFEVWNSLFFLYRVLSLSILLDMVWYFNKTSKRR